MRTFVIGSDMRFVGYEVCEADCGFVFGFCSPFVVEDHFTGRFLMFFWFMMLRDLFCLFLISNIYL